MVARKKSAWLEGLIDESVFIIREAVACERPALLFSGGKDSAVVAWLARMAFLPAPVPFPLLHIDTGHNYPEVISFRDSFARDFGFTLVSYHMDTSISRGTVQLSGPDASRNAAQAVSLLEAINDHRFGALIGGARRDEEKARAKERIFSHRGAFGAWDPRRQRPELWDLFNTHCSEGEHLRVFPISNWTEVDVWEFIASQEIPLPSLYYAHRREVARRKGLLIPRTPVTVLLPEERTEYMTVRFRTVGDMSCTCPVESKAHDAWAVLEETRRSTVGERESTRMDDRVSEYAMESRKRLGYF